MRTETIWNDSTMAAAGVPCHSINKQDLNDYMKLLSLEKGCPVDNIDRNKAHWEFIFNKEQCLRKVIKYREELFHLWEKL